MPRTADAAPELTTTSYAILGLLAMRPWTTYELAQQMQRSLHNFWPRAESRIYEEPKRLARHGLVTASRDQVGRRPRTVYAITAKGRRALTAWLATSATEPQLESDALVKVFLAEFGAKSDILDRIDELRGWAGAKQAEHTLVARSILDGTAPFPDRLPQLTVVGRLLSDFADLVANWADWAAGVVADWPEDPAAREPEWTVIEHMAARGLPGAVHRSVSDATVESK